MQKNTTYFFKASGIILSNFGKIHFFPLKKFKKDLEYFQKIGPQRGPDPPHKGKNFSLHFWTNWTILHTLKKMQKIDFAQIPPPNAEFSAFFFFFLLCIVPLLDESLQGRSFTLCGMFFRTDGGWLESLWT